jgi:hypothetical protein
MCVCVWKWWMHAEFCLENIKGYEGMDRRVTVKCVGDTDCGLGWSGSGEGVMATFNLLETLGSEFQLLPGWRNFKLKLHKNALSAVHRVSNCVQDSACGLVWQGCESPLDCIRVRNSGLAKLTSTSSRNEHLLLWCCLGCST